jgi:tRNA(His) 5'-end guanylyltransferase
VRFDELDLRMRVYETNHDHRVLPGMFMVARIDGRGFTKLTRERHPFDAPYDIRFRDLMLETMEHIMSCGFRTVLAYTQSDEISILFDPADESFSRKERKYLSILAGEASARFSLSLGELASFDARLSLMPSPNLVIDYFRWRMEDAARNCLNSHCYWMLRKEGAPAEVAASSLKGLGSSQKHELLYSHGVNFNDLPAWQRRGCGCYYTEKPKSGLDPRNGHMTTTIRRTLTRDLELPVGDAIAPLILTLLGAG